MVLTDRERKELHDALREYCAANGWGGTVAAFNAEEPATTAYKDNTGLEKKWNTIRRLNARNLELEAQVKALKADLATLQDPSAAKTDRKKDVAIAEPCSHSLVGHRDSISSVSLHPFEPMCFTASEDGSVRVWETDTGDCIRTLRGHTENITWCSVEPTEGRLVATASNDTTIKLYDTNSGECLRTLHGHEEAVTCVQWLGDSFKTLLSAGRDGDVRLWDTERGGLKATLPSQDEWVRCLAVNGRGTSVAWAGNDEIVSVYNIKSNAITRTLSGHTNVVQSIAFSTPVVDDVIIDAHGSADMKQHHREILKRRQQQLDAGATVPPEMLEGRYLASGGRDKNILVHDVATGSSVMSFEEHDNWVRHVQFMPNGKFLISCADDGTVRLWDLIKKRQFRKITAHGHFVTCLALHPKNKPIVITGSADKSAKLWPCRPI